MFTMATATLIGAIISGVIATGSAIANTVSQAKTNQTNKQNVQDTNALNEQLTREQWKRDDSQLQRARADAEAAGFSPLAALSNNLTNSAAATMQAPQQIAPQFDSSGIVESIQSGVRDYNNAKLSDEQKKYIKQQTKALSLENAFNASNNWTRKLQNVANLAKTMRELDSQNLSNYEKASILVASGIPISTVQKLIPHTKETVVKNTSQDSLINLQKAQTKLADAQKTLTDEQATTESHKRALADAQEALATIEKDIKSSEHDYLWKQKISAYLPVITNNGNGVKIDWEYSDSIPRKQAFDLIQNALDTLSIKRAGQEVNSDTYNKILDAIDKIIPF